MRMSDSDSEREYIEDHDPCCPLYKRKQTKKEDGTWIIQKTEGQKHFQRSRKLCSVKKSEAFEEKYEDTREEREQRQHEADRKRKLMEI